MSNIVLLLFQASAGLLETGVVARTSQIHNGEMQQALNDLSKCRRGPVPDGEVLADVNRGLCDAEHGRWLMIVDSVNAKQSM